MDDKITGFEITNAGLYSTIQDFGRNRSRFFAVPSSGVMDHNAATYANQILSNLIDHPIIECNLSGMGLQFHHEMNIALTGADFGWKLNGNTVDLNTKILVIRGDKLTGGFSHDKARGYIAFDKELQENKVLGSYSTYPLAKIGANQGRILRKGDIIKISEKKSLSLAQAAPVIIKDKNQDIIKIQKGPEWDLLSPSSKRKFCMLEYQISSRSDRMAAHLKTTEQLDLQEYPKYSNCIIPGMIQLNYHGELMVILRDGQTTGGYPRVVYITHDNLNLFNQILPHRNFKFELQ